VVVIAMFGGWGLVAFAATMSEKSAQKYERHLAKVNKVARVSLWATNPVQSARNRNK
jgi:hypothetical protein